MPQEHAVHSILRIRCVHSTGQSVSSRATPCLELSRDMSARSRFVAGLLENQLGFGSWKLQNASRTIMTSMDMAKRRRRRSRHSIKIPTTEVENLGGELVRGQATFPDFSLVTPQPSVLRLIRSKLGLTHSDSERGHYVDFWMDHNAAERHLMV